PSGAASGAASAAVDSLLPEASPVAASAVAGVGTSWAEAAGQMAKASVVTLANASNFVPLSKMSPPECGRTLSQFPAGLFSARAKKYRNRDSKRARRQLVRLRALCVCLPAHETPGAGWRFLPIVTAISALTPY